MSHIEAIPRIRKYAMEIGTESVTLKGDLNTPEMAKGIVVFVHGSGSSRLSPRNQFIAGSLWKEGFATLLFDLLTSEERIDIRTNQLHLDINLLTGRVLGAIQWIAGNPYTRDLRIGVFGSGTGAAAALIAAVNAPGAIGAVVSRGGRPDCAMSVLARVRVPTLFIVGGHDYPVIDLNRRAMEKMMSAENKVEIVPNAGHLFEEPGAMERVVGLACEWFGRYLASGSESL